MKECSTCGAGLKGGSACLFCGEEPSISFERGSTGLKNIRWATLLVFGTIFLVVGVRSSYQMAMYNPMVALKSTSFQQARQALAQGETTKARAMLQGLREEMWYSGLPDVYLAATYYQEYLRTREGSALDQMGVHLSEGRERELSFVAKYLLAYYLFERGQKSEAVKAFEEAHQTLSNPGSPWPELMDKGMLNSSMSQMVEAIESDLTFVVWSPSVGARPNRPVAPVVFDL